MAPWRLGVAGEHRGERSVIADGGVYHPAHRGNGMEPGVDAQVMEGKHHNVFLCAQAQSASVIDMVGYTHGGKWRYLAMARVVRARAQHSPHSQHLLDQRHVILDAPGRPRQRMALPALPFQARQSAATAQEQPVADRPPRALLDPFERCCKQFQANRFVDRIES